jgi:hypothetical protein
MNRHEISPGLSSSLLDRGALTPGSRGKFPTGVRVHRRTPTINHARAAFTENKRYPAKPRGIADVVNRKAVSVYQTDAVLVLVGGVQRRRSGAATTKQ